MDEAVNAFKHSLADSASDLKRAIATITQSTTSAIKNIEKAAIEQGKKNQGGYQKKYSDSDRKLSAIHLNPITDPTRAEAQAKQHAPLFAGKGDYKGLDVEQTAVKLKEDILGISEGKPTRKFGHSKMLRTPQEESDINYNDASYRTRSRGYRLIGKEATEAVMAKISTTKTDAEGNIHFQEDFKAASLVFDNIEYAQKQKKEEKIEADKAEAKAERLKEKEERKRENLLKEFRAEFKDTEKEIQNEERQQVLALKERQQLQLGVGNDLIQGGAGMAMGVALNKPTIIFASLATSAAKVTSRFGKLGKILGVLIATLSAGVGIANVLSGRTKDNIKSGARAHISPETANALKEAGDKFLEDPNALIETASRITDLKATISTPIGFSQQLATLGQTGITPILSKIGMNPLQLLNKVNNSTTEELLYWFGEKVLPSIKNDNEQREFANTLGIGRLLEGNIQLSTTFGKKTGIMQEVREIKAEAGQLTAESKYQQYKTAKEGAIAGAKWGINNLTVEKFGGAVEIFYKAVSKFSDLASGGKGNNTRQINAMDNLRNHKLESIDNLKTILNNSNFADRADIFDAFIASDIESNSTAVEYQKLKKAQDQARTLQAQIQNLPKKQQEAQKAKFLNSFITAPIRKVSNESGVTQGVRYESDKPAKNDINFNLTLKDQTGNGVVAYSTGGN